MNKTVNSNSKEILPIVKSTEKCEIDCYGRIVCANAACEIQTTEALGKELRLNLVTTFKIISLKDDGEYELAVQRKESTVSVVNENISPSAKCVMLANVTACSCSEKGVAVADIEISGWILKENEIAYADSAADGILYRTEKFCVENVVCLEEKTVSVTNTNEARLPLKKILDYSSTVAINSVYPAIGGFQVDGDIVSRLVAVSDSGIVVTQTFVSPFSTEITDSYVSAESVLDVYARPVKTNLTVTDTDTRVFVTETEIKVIYAVSEKTEIEAIADCYSKENYLNVTESTNTVNTSSCYRSIRDKVTTYVKSESVIEEVLCVNAPFVSDISVIADGALKAEGIVSAKLVYSDENGVKTAPCEVPFSSVVATDFDCTETFFPEIKITSVNARIRSTTEAEVSFELLITVRGVNSHELKLVSDIEICGEKTESEYAISLYIVKPGETVWDVAKALNTDEETVFRLNPEISVPFKGGEKVLVYNELVYGY